MAAKKKGGANRKKEQGEGGADNFVPADRPDQVSAGANDLPGVVDVLGLEDGQTINIESRTEGDGRDLQRETDRGARDLDDDDGRADRRARREGRDDRDDDDERGYSRKVRRRVAREQAINRGLRQEIGKERTLRESLEKRLARLEQGTTEQAASADIKTIEAQIAKVTEDLEAAIEAGETKKQMSLQIKLGDLQGDLKLKKYEAEQARKAAIAARSTETQTRETQEGPTDVDAPDVDEFIQANKHWWGRKRFRRERNAAIVIDGQILEEINDGELDFEKYSPEHFEELGKRLKEHYPNLEVCDPDGDPIEPGDDDDEDGEQQRGHMKGRNGREQRNGRPPQGGVGTRGGRRVDSEVALAQQGKVALTDEDFKEMRIFNLDPNNPEHKKRFARERLRTIKSTGQGVRS